MSLFQYKDLRLASILGKVDGPLTVSEYINNSTERIHKQLFDAAIEAYKKDMDDAGTPIDEKSNIIEVRNKVYYLPSSIYIIKEGKKSKLISLDKYWNNFFRDYLKNTYIPCIKDVDIENAELIYIDYLKGIARFRDKIENIEFEVDIKNINENTFVAEDYVLSNTFGYQINQIK